MKEKLMELLLRVNPSIDPESVTMESDIQADLGLQSPNWYSCSWTSKTPSM